MKVGIARLGESGYTISPKTPTHIRKEEKEKKKIRQKWRDKKIEKWPKNCKPSKTNRHQTLKHRPKTVQV